MARSAATATCAPGTASCTARRGARGRRHGAAGIATSRRRGERAPPSVRLRLVELIPTDRVSVAFLRPCSQVISRQWTVTISLEWKYCFSRVSSKASGLRSQCVPPSAVAFGQAVNRLRMRTVVELYLSCWARAPSGGSQASLESSRGTMGARICCLVFSLLCVLPLTAGSELPFVGVCCAFGRAV